MTGFADQNDVLDLRSAENFVDFGQVGIGGFVATTDDDREIIIRESIHGDAGRRSAGRKIIVVIFNIVQFADKFETVR